MNIETLGKRAAAITAIMLFAGGMLGAFDSRYALAADVQGIYDRMDRRDVFDTEDKIEEVSLKIARLDRIPVLDEVEMYELSILIERKAKLLRRLKSYQDPTGSIL